MADLKINGNTYHGVERVRIPTSDGLGSVTFCEAAMLDSLIMGESVEIYNTAITKIATRVFAGANITVLNLPNCQSMGYQQLIGCKATEMRFPAMTDSGGSAVLSCPNLVKVVFGELLQSLGSQTFNGCSKLATLVLPYNGVVALGDAAIKSSAIENGTGYVYVPASQVEAYKANSAWSAYADQIRAIEDYPDEVA